MTYLVVLRREAQSPQSHTFHHVAGQSRFPSPFEEASSVCCSGGTKGRGWRQALSSWIVNACWIRLLRARGFDSLDVDVGAMGSIRRHAHPSFPTSEEEEELLWWWRLAISILRTIMSSEGEIGVNQPCLQEGKWLRSPAVSYSERMGWNFLGTSILHERIPTRTQHSFHLHAYYS